MTVYSKYLHTGIYTMSDAARLIDAPAHRIRRWVCGDTHDYSVAPLIKSQIEPIDGHVVMSFTNLIEALFIAKFSAYGVHVKSIRAMAEEAKSLIHEHYKRDTDHPFATDIMFKTDGETICAVVAEKHADKRLYNLKKHNWALEPIFGPGLKAAVSYKDLHANLWYPNKRRTPNVVVNPTAAFGQPVMKDTGIPTSALYDSYIAEGKDASIVAKWFETSKRRVLEAVRFETFIAQSV